MIAAVAAPCSLAATQAAYVLRPGRSSPARRFQAVCEKRCMESRDRERPQKGQRPTLTPPCRHGRIRPKADIRRLDHQSWSLRGGDINSGRHPHQTLSAPRFSYSRSALAGKCLLLALTLGISRGRSFVPLPSRVVDSFTTPPGFRKADAVRRCVAACWTQPAGHCLRTRRLLCLGYRPSITSFQAAT